MRQLAVVAVLAIALAPSARAHEGGHHVRGIIKEVSAQRLVVTDQAGADVTFSVTPATAFQRDGKPARREDARPGERVVVHGAPAGAAMDATVVMLAGAPGPAKVR